MGKGYELEKRVLAMISEQYDISVEPGGQEGHLHL